MKVVNSLFQRAAILCLAVAAMVSVFPSKASALSAGCTQWTFTGNTNGVSGSNLAFQAGERATVRLTEINGNSVPYTFTHTDIANGNTVATRSGTLSPHATVTEVIVVSQNTTSGRLSLTIGAGGPVTAVLSCTGPAPAADSTSQSTSSAVIASVSRAQTTVISRNIGARLSAVGSLAGTATAGWVTGGGIADDDNTIAGFAYDPAYDHPRSTLSANDNALRRIVMMGNFDSSSWKGGNMPGLGPAERGGAAGPGGVEGRSAFDAASPFTVWGNGSYLSVDNDYVSGGTDNRYDGGVWGYNVGLDYRFGESLTAGLSLGYNDADLTTSFNRGTYEETGWVISPYAIYRPLSGLTISGMAGFGIGDIDVTRNNNAVSGDTKSHTWFAQFNTSYRVRPAQSVPLSLTSAVSFTAGSKTADGYTESDATVVAETTANTRRVRPSIEAAYDLAPTPTLTVTPFIATGLIHDFTDEINNDKTAFDIGGGIRLFQTDSGLGATIEGSYLAGRSGYNEYTIGGTLFYGFDLVGDDGRSIGTVKPFLTANLNEYGHQRLRTGLGFSAGALTSELAFGHAMSVVDDDEVEGADTSIISFNMTLAL